MGMRRTPGTRRLHADAIGGMRGHGEPIPLDPIGLVAGIAPGVELEATLSPDRSAPPAPVSVEEVGRLLRCSEATVRRLIRTAVLRPVGVGERYVRRSDLEDYRSSLHRRAPGKPGE